MTPATTSPLDWAHEYAARGLRVLPIARGTKYPPMKNWPEVATIDADTIDQWWGIKYVGHGVGIATGEGSSVFVIDIDIADGKTGDETLAALEDEHGPLPATATVRTGSGGEHRYFNLPTGISIRNDAGKRLGAGLDVRGMGGQVVAPPTVHPITGALYEWEGGTPGEIADAPEWLIELLTTPAAGTGPLQAVSPSSPTSSGDDGPAQRYNERTNWTEILNADGWTCAEMYADGEQRWVRPGKDECDGISATVGHEGRDILTVFTTSLEWLPDGSYSRFGYYACRFHGGDRSAAASALRSEDFADVDAALARVSTLNQSSSPTPINCSEDWEEAFPLPGDGGIEGFCSDDLGDIAGSFARAVSEAKGTPIDVPSVAILGVVSTAIGGAVVVESREGWRQGVNLYLLSILERGEGKTPVLSLVKSVLDEIEATREEQVRVEIIEAEQALRIAESRKKDAETRAAKSNRTNRLEAEEEARNAGLDAALITIPPTPRIYTQEATPEALVKLLGEQNGRLGVISDEGGEFFELAARYTTGGKGNLGIYLNGADGQRYISDRAGRSPIIIKRATLTVSLMAQPQVIEDLARDRQAAGRGLFARFLWTRPHSLVGHRKTNRPPEPAPLIADYEDLIRTLATEAAAVKDEPLILRLSPGASALFSAFEAQHEPRLAPDTGDLHSITEWASKLPGQVLRLAGNLHALRMGTIHGFISEETMSAALSMGAYFTSHALKVLGQMRADEVTADAASLIRFLRNRKIEQISLREIYTRRDWTRERTRAAIEVLERYGWVRRVDLEPKPGRPTELWAIHPKLRSETPQNPNTRDLGHTFGQIDQEQVAS